MSTPRLLLLLLLLLSRGVDASAPAPVRAKLRLQSKQTLHVELTGRDGATVLFREPGKTAEIGLPARDIAWVDFDLDYKGARLDDHLQAQDFKAAALALEPLLKPLYPYLDLPSDLPRQATQLMQLLWRSSQYDQTVTTSYLIQRHAKDEGLRRLAQAYRVVAFIELGRLHSAVPELRQLGVVTRKDENLIGPYFYAQARLQILQTNWVAAHQSAAQIVAFQPKNFEWMPAGLYLSARCYGETGQFEVADQIIAEIATAYPKTRWAELAAQLSEELARKKQELEQAQAKAKEENAKEEQ
jgi:tetratricopeptide (TPR) repeat protein